MGTGCGIGRRYAGLIVFPEIVKPVLLPNLQIHLSGRKHVPDIADPRFIIRLDGEVWKMICDCHSLLLDPVFHYHAIEDGLVCL